MDALWINIFRRRAKEETLSFFLKGVPVFAGMRRRDLRHIEPFLQVRHYKAGEMIFEEGDPGSGMYFVRAGQVQVFTRSLDREEEVALLKKGDFFGETSLIIGEPRTASARAIDKVELVGLFRSDLDYIVENQEQLACRILFNLTATVCKRLQAVGNDLRFCRLEQKTTADVEERVLVESDGGKSDGDGA